MREFETDGEVEIIEESFGQLWGEAISRLGVANRIEVARLARQKGWL